MNIQAEQAPQHFDKQSSTPVTLIYGEETLLNVEAADAWRQCVLKEGYSERQRLDSDGGFRWPTLLNEFDTPSLFASKRAIELHSDDKKFNKAAGEILKALASRQSDSIRLLIYAPNLEKPHTAGWYKALFNGQNTVVQSKALYPSTLARQIDQRLRNAKLHLTEDAYQRLMDYCQGNLLAAQQAIDRLKIHPEHKSVIGPNLLSDLLSDVSHFGVFTLSDALLSGHWLEAWKITNKLRDEHADQATLVTWLIQRDMNTLLQLHTLPPQQHGDMFKQYRLYSPQQQKRYQQAKKRFSPALIRNTLKLCAKLDRLTKGAEAGDFWLTLSQYLLLLAQRHHATR
ncbi:DNA polymerase III subunit delta [Cardiobacteriaceae bacterium TAE3-ERU3]|nr:DNA polymerase III subunit delta [Cardiobacteriaceae bacterium TAE3-ERU3]